MTKLFDLKPWVSVVDAARELAQAFEEDVTEADVLRLGLDGHLTLSVYFTNFAQARIGKIVPIDEAIKRTLISPISNEPLPVYQGVKISGDEVIQLDEKVERLEGVWDLTMLGAERLGVESRYHALTDGPDVTLVNLDGTFVCNDEGVICQLQERFSDNLKRPFDHPDNFFPAGGLPSDSMLVIRTANLKQLLDPSTKPTAERNRELQEDANSLAEEWKRDGKRSFSLEDIADVLAASDKWMEMTSARVLRLIKRTW